MVNENHDNEFLTKIYDDVNDEIACLKMDLNDANDYELLSEKIKIEYKIKGLVKARGIIYDCKKDNKSLDDALNQIELCYMKESNHSKKEGLKIAKDIVMKYKYHTSYVME